MHGFWKPVCCAALLMLAVAPLGTAADIAFVEALRERGLDRLAERQCRQQLANESLPPLESAQYAIQWSLIERDRAFTSRENRDAYWRRAQAVLDGVPATRGPHDAWLLLRVQSGLNRSTRGEFEQATGIPSAATTLQSAARELAEAHEDIESLLRTGSQSFEARELESLSVRTQLARARTQRRLALCHPAGSPDRDDALLQAAGSAEGVVSRNVNADLKWEARLLLLECDRLLGKPEQGLTRLADTRWNTPAVPNQFASAVAAERWRLLVAAGQESQATRWLASQRSRQETPEIALANLEALMRRWSSIEDKQREELARQVQEALASIRVKHGGLWTARAEQIAGEALSISAASGSVEALVATAEYQFRAGRLDQAVDAYDRAAGEAFRNGAPGRAFELARTAAAIVRSQGKPAQAAERFRRAALSSSLRPDAAATHHLAILCAAEALKAPQSDSTGAGQLYLSLLKEHTTTWPDSKHADQVAWWLVQYRAAQGEFQQVVPLLQAIPPTDTRHEQAIRLLGDGFTKMAQSAGDDVARRHKVLVETTATLQPIITGADNRWPTTWTTLQRETAFTLATLHDGDYARQLLTAAIDGLPQPQDPAWLNRANAKLVLVLLDSGRSEEARTRLANQTFTAREDAEPLLMELQDRLTGEHRDAAARLTLAITQAAPSSDDQGLWKAGYAALALATLGRAKEAIDLYEQLLKQRPRDARLRLSLAAALAATGNAQLLEHAIDHYATIEQGVAKGGALWWDARLGRMRAMIAAGQIDKATKLLKLTQILHRDLGGRRAEVAVIEQSLESR